MRFKTLSWRAFPHHVLTPFPFQSSLIPSLHFSWSVNLLLLRDFQTFMRARWMKAISPPNMSSSQCLHSALSSSLYASLSRLHFFCPLFFFLYRSLSHPFITRASVKSDRPDKCGSMVTQIPRAPERAKINHFTPSLSSAIFSLCLCSPPSFNLPALLFHSIFLLVIFWIPFSISFLFQYVAFSLLTL